MMLSQNMLKTWLNIIINKGNIDSRFFFGYVTPMRLNKYHQFSSEDFHSAKWKKNPNVIIYSKSKAERCSIFAYLVLRSIVHEMSSRSTVL